ncbi:MAG: transposase [Alphaproteobacteria bacterium]
MGRGRKGLGTKIHVALSPDRVLGACLSCANRVDMKAFPDLWKLSDWTDVHYIIADKGYDYYDVRTLIRSAQKIPVIPRRKGAVNPGVEDKERYLTRHCIERFFAALKENKRMALRYDKLDTTFFSFFAIACLKILKMLC